MAASNAELEQARVIAELLKKNGFNPEEIIGKLKQVRLNEWETTIAGKDGPETVTNHGISLVLNAQTDDGQPIPEIRQAEPVTVNVRTPRRLPARRPTEGRWAIVYPDAQRPFVDHAAVDVGHQILEDLEAEHGVSDVIHLGDDLDLPDFSTHRSAPEVLGLLNEAINDQYRTLAIEKALAPKAKRKWLAGNHEQRIVNWLVDHAPQLIGLRRAGDRPEEPVISIPFLCRLKELGVDYVGPYPEGEVWLNEHLRLIHGSTVKPGKGATGAHYLQQGHMSTVAGHIHRSELVYTTRHTPRGPRTYLAGSPGCLARIDGKVPSSKSGITPDGEQGMQMTEDWQQGVWVVWYEATGRQFYSVEHIAIWSGWAMWRGREYLARCDINGDALQEVA